MLLKEATEKLSLAFLRVCATVLQLTESFQFFCFCLPSPQKICLLHSKENLFTKAVCYIDIDSFLLHFRPGYTQPHTVYTHTTYLLLFFFLTLFSTAIEFLLYLVVFIWEMKLHCTPVYQTGISFLLTCYSPDAGDSVWWRGGIDPCCAPCW